jgi:hypothetical protein
VQPCPGEPSGTAGAGRHVEYRPITVLRDRISRPRLPTDTGDGAPR